MSEPKPGLWWAPGILTDAEFLMRLRRQFAHVDPRGDRLAEIASRLDRHPMLDVLEICDAYESGMGQGLKNKPMGEYRNPHDPVHSPHACRAYAHGYDEGVKRAAFQSGESHGA